MNERIKELADEAKVTVLTSKGHPDIVDGCYIISPPKLEKFAELIVKECVKMCDEVHRDYGMAPDTARISKRYIKEHFGVTE